MTEPEIRSDGTRHRVAGSSSGDRSSCVVRRVVGFLWVGFAMILVPPALLASGETFLLIGHDLQIDVDSRWVGCGQGGYCPVRIRVTNRGPTRTLTFRITKTYQPVVGVRQTLEVPQNARLDLTLSVPLVNYSNNAELRVEDAGGLLDGLRHSLSLPEANTSEVGRPGLLVVAPSVVDLQPFEDGATTFRHTGGGGGSVVSPSHHFGGYRTNNAIALPKNALPGSWVDYSGLDLIAIPLETLAELPSGTRTALAQWMRCGGTLLVTSVGEERSLTERLGKLLVGDTAPAVAWAWSPPKIADRNLNQVVHQDISGGITTLAPPPTNEPGAWPQDANPFQMADVGFGKLVAFRSDPFPGTAQDWFWLLKSLGGFSRWDWGKRHGLASRIGNSDFLLFLIPGIGGVPVIMFLVLITIFTVVIGPLNYFLLARRKQLHLLLVTIPGIAFVTSLLLFGYTIVAHGFSVKARCRSLTYVDQAAQSAVTFNRLSIYAGQAPSSGLQFSRETAVFPIWPENEGFESGQVDWTHTQALTSGWLRSRTRTQFLTVGHRTERGRVEVTSNAAGTLTVANGFEWGFEPFVVADDQARLYFSPSLPAGASSELQPLNDDLQKVVATALLRSPLELPKGLSHSGASSSWFGGPGYRYRSYLPYSSVRWSYQESLMEQALQRLRKGVVLPGPLPLEAELAPVPRTYFGLATQTPRVDLGGLKAKEIHSLHVVMGRW